MKMIEKVASSRAQHIHSMLIEITKKNKERGDRAANLELIMKGAALAAIDALDIIILEKGAEPQMGDIILDDENEPRIVIKTSRGNVFWHEDEDYGYCYRNLVQIIQRNGKPVVMEK